MVRFAGRVSDTNGKPMNGVVGLTFSLYTDEQGGVPLWFETQNIQLDAGGRYSVSLGATKPDGLPIDLFASGDARWLGVQPEGQAEFPRVLLLAVPYALKAADAETVGGLPPSAFVLASPSVNGPAATTTAGGAQMSAASSSGIAPASTVTGTGAANYLPLWTTTSNMGSSVLYQSGSGTSAKVGIGTTSPAATLDVKGTANVEGTLSLLATGTATSFAGFSSQPLSTTASAFSSSSSKAVGQYFNLQAEPTGNNTSSPSATLNLLFGSGGSKPTETGLSIGSTGLITFAPGQTLPNVSGNETVSGNLSATGIVTGSGYQIGSNLFAFGSYANENAFVGFAGNTTSTNGFNTAIGFSALQANNTGGANTASGASALAFNTSGGDNTASGVNALYSNTLGSYNTASGAAALQSNTTGNSNTAAGNFAGYTSDGSYVTGSNNTAVGALAALGTGSLANATAIGANAEVTESNALVLGCIAGLNNCVSNVSVGIGTSNPSYPLVVQSGTAGFTFDATTQMIGTTFGYGGSLILAVTDAGNGSTNGGTIYLGGSARGDALQTPLPFTRAPPSICALTALRADTTQGMSASELQPHKLR
jgi:hypothetical protein